MPRALARISAMIAAKRLYGRCDERRGDSGQTTVLKTNVTRGRTRTDINLPLRGQAPSYRDTPGQRPFKSHHSQINDARAKGLVPSVQRGRSARRVARHKSEPATLFRAKDSRVLCLVRPVARRVQLDAGTLCFGRDH